MYKSAENRSHAGIEYSVNYNNNKNFEALISGSVANHKYIKYQDEAKIFDGYKMPWASNHTFLVSATYKAKIKTNMLASTLSVNRIGKYFLDDFNTIPYKGHTLFNFIFNYFLLKQNLNIFIQGYNIFNVHHAVLAYKGKYGYGYNLGEPITFNFGINFKLP